MSLALTVQEFEILILESTLERSKEHEARCRRRARAAIDEQTHASEQVIRVANQLEAARHNLLRKAR